MKVLIVYYSRSGQTRKLAELITHKLSADSEEIKDDQQREGVPGFILCGNEAYLRKTIKIRELKNKPENYDIVIIGTPVWAGNICSPIRSFLEKYKKNFKRVSFFCTSLGSDTNILFQEMEDIIQTKPLAVMAVSKRDILKKAHIQMIEKYIEKIFKNQNMKGEI